jgi:hypothetical protein
MKSQPLLNRLNGTHSTPKHTVVNHDTYFVQFRVRIRVRVRVRVRVRTLTHSEP